MTAAETPTLATPVRDWTDQQVFDFVAEHLIRQGRKSVKNNSDECRYRGPGCLKCAIGALIPDYLYRGCLESQSVYQLPEDIQHFLGSDSEGRLQLLDDLQEAHDSCDHAFDEIKNRLYAVAIRHCLSWAALASQVPA